MKQLTLLLCAALLMTACSRENNLDALRPANEMVRLIRQGHASEAYQQMALDYRRRTSFNEFNYEARQLNGAPDAQVQWSEPVIENERVRVQGQLTREDGSEAEIRMTLVKEVGAWTPSKFDVR